MKRYTFLKRKSKILRRDNRLKVNGLRVYFIKSNKHYYASLIDNNNGNVLASLSTQKVSTFDKPSKEKISDLALAFADKIKSLGFANADNINFDRGVYRFHGLVKYFVEEVRKQEVRV